MDWFLYDRELPHGRVNEAKHEVSHPMSTDNCCNHMKVKRMD